MSTPDPKASPTATPPLNTFLINDPLHVIVSITPNGVWKVSDGQSMITPPKVTPTPGPTNVFEIDLYAGRQDTSKVADKFNKLSGGAGYACSTTLNMGEAPRELNFFYGVDIVVVQASTGMQETVTAYIGQGSNDIGENNWWIGGSCISSNGNVATLSVWFGNSLVCFPFSGSSDNAFSFGNIAGPIIRTNVVTLQDNSKTIVKVTPTGVPVLAGGQPMNIPPSVTPNIMPSSNNFLIELDAGRSDNPSVASSFNSACGGASNEWGIGTATDSSPSELNFYFGVELTLQVGTNTTVETVYLGQGDAASGANNWWIGGSCISGSGQLSAVVGGQTVTLNLSSTESFGFIFSAASD